MRQTAVAAATLATVLLVASCGSSKATGTSGRPSTSARLQILEPTANAKTGPDVVLKLQLTGAQIAPPEQVKGKLSGNKGHVHVSVDGTVVSMNYGLSAPLPHLAPGQHTVQAEFVAIDHASFRNRVVTAVLFDVQ